MSCHRRIWDSDLWAFQAFQLIKELVQTFGLTWKIHWSMQKASGPLQILWSFNGCISSWCPKLPKTAPIKTELQLQSPGYQVEYMSTQYLYIDRSIIVCNYDLIKPAGRLSFFVIFARTFQMLPLRLGSGIGNACKGEQWIGNHMEWERWERHVYYLTTCDLLVK